MSINSEFEERNIAAARNLCDKWRLVIFNRSSNLRERFQKDFRQHFRSQIALRRQNECAHSRAADRLLFRYAVTNALVPRDNDPIVPPSRSKPFCIGCILRKVIVMNFNVKACLAEDSGHFVTPELAIEKENEFFFKRLRRG